MDHPDAFKFYLAANQDGYPPEWSRLPGETFGIKHLVRAEAGNRCVRCQHPYEVGTPLNEGWSPCDERCRHAGPMRVMTTEGWSDFDARSVRRGRLREAQAAWRILTVHHLNGMKLDCRWWNLAALCQRCHLTIQGKVRLERAFIREHSDWFKPYAAGWYAHKYLNEDLTRAETLARLDDLLSFELTEEALF